MKSNSKKLFQKWSLAVKILPIVISIAIVKFLVHKYNLEVMELNALFTSLVAGTIFLIGFLISGVLSDYKESEKIPSELTASLRTLFDDTYTVYKVKKLQRGASVYRISKNICGRARGLVL